MADKITIANSTTLQPLLSDYAVELRVIFHNKAATQYIIGKYNDSIAQGWLLYATYVNPNLFISGKFNNLSFTATAGAFAQDVEYHLLLNIDRDGYMQCFINGTYYTNSQVVISSLATTSIANTDDLLIADSDLGTGYITVREVRIYKRLLSDTEIAWLPIHPEDVYDWTNLVCYLKCDEGSGLYCADLSGNGNNGTIDNGEWLIVKYVGCYLVLDKEKGLWIKEGENVLIGGPMVVWNDKLIVGCGESGGTKPNLVYLDETVNTERGLVNATMSFNSVWTTPQIDWGTPDIHKQTKYIMVEYMDKLKYSGSSFNIYIRLDDGIWTKINTSAIALGAKNGTITKNFAYMSNPFYRIDLRIEAEYDLEISRIMIYPDRLTKTGDK